MLGSIFYGQLRHSWRQVLTWGIGLAVLMFYVTAVIQDPAVIEGYRGVLESFPPAFLSAFGVSDASSLTTPEGFIGFAGFTYGGIILAVFGVLTGLNITANDEDNGVMNVLLALPVPRWRLIVERFAAYTIITILIILMVFVGIVVGTIAFSVDLNYMTMLLGTVNLIPATLTVMAVTTFIASIFSNKVIVTGIAAAFVSSSYFLNVVADLVDTDSLPIAGILGRLSVFSYLDSETVLREQVLQTGNILALLVATVLLVVVSVMAFERRDISG